jgi:flagellar basal body rod protein FlgB
MISCTANHGSLADTPNWRVYYMSFKSALKKVVGVALFEWHSIGIDLH